MSEGKKEDVVLTTTVTIKDHISEEEIEIQIEEVNKVAVELKASLTTEDQEKYHMLTLLVMASILKGIEHPEKIFDINEMMKMGAQDPSITPGFGGPVGEA